MPELPEVETIRRALIKNVMHKTIQQFIPLRLDFFWHGNSLYPQLAGGTIESIDRRGKILALWISSGQVVFIHLGMSGRLVLSSPHTPLEKHTHVRIVFHDLPDEMRLRDPRRFGYIALFPADQANSFESWREMGPDPLHIRRKQFFQILRKHHRSIKSVLLDQHCLGGMGNIYVDESLFRCRLHPACYADQLTEEQSDRLLSCIKRVLNESILAGGSSTNDFQQLDGTFGEFQHKHRVYRREGKPCISCKHTIVRVVMQGRGTHYCPYCQPIPQS